MAHYILSKNLVSETLFWLHFLIIILALSIGLFFPWQIVLVLAIVHRLHTWIFRGCIFSKIEHRLGNLDQQSDYLQHMVKRITGKVINTRQSKILDYGFLSITILVTVLHTVIKAGLLPVSSLLLTGAALCGLAVSLILTYQNKRFQTAGCLGVCNPVLKSQFARIGRISVSELGVLFYTTCLITLIASVWLDGLDIILLALGIIGMSASVCFLFLQAFVIRAFCRWCLVSAGAAITFFVVSLRYI